MACVRLGAGSRCLRTRPALGTPSCCSQHGMQLLRAAPLSNPCMRSGLACSGNDDDSTCSQGNAFGYTFTASPSLFYFVAVQPYSQTATAPTVSLKVEQAARTCTGCSECQACNTATGNCDSKADATTCSVGSCVAGVCRQCGASTCRSTTSTSGTLDIFDDTCATSPKWSTRNAHFVVVPCSTVEKADSSGGAAGACGGRADGFQYLKIK